MRADVKLDVKGIVAYVVGASNTGEPVAYVTTEAGTVPLSGLDLPTPSLFTAATIVLYKPQLLELTS